MNRPTYPFYNTIDGFEYFFISDGVQGKILKGISIIRMPNEFSDSFSPIYNLAFGDVKNTVNGWKIDDSIRTGNGDMPKVIATVAMIAIDFLTGNKGATLSFQGYIDDKSLAIGKNQRNILYQRSINSNWEELCPNFSFWGLKENALEEYSTGSQYERILIKLK